MAGERRLGFQRRTLSAALLFSPLPAGWDVAPRGADGGGDLTIPKQVIQHRAVLSTPAGVPFSVVVETYTDKVLPDRALLWLPDSLGPPDNDVRRYRRRW